MQHILPRAIFLALFASAALAQPPEPAPEIPPREEAPSAPPESTEEETPGEEETPPTRPARPAPEAESDPTGEPEGASPSGIESPGEAPSADAGVGAVSGAQPRRNLAREAEGPLLPIVSWDPSPPPPPALARPTGPAPEPTDAEDADAETSAHPEALDDPEVPAEPAGAEESAAAEESAGAEESEQAPGAPSGERPAVPMGSADARSAVPEREPLTGGSETIRYVRSVTPQTIVQPVIQSGDDENSALGEELTTFVDALDTERSAGAIAVLTLLLLVSILGARVLRRSLQGLAPRGLLPSLFRSLNLVLRSLALVLLVFLVLQLLPERLAFALLLAVGGFAVAVGWAFGDVLPDFVAGVVLLFENRVRRGVWITGEGYGGQVERFDLRSTHLRDAQGHRVAVPNRRVLSSPFTIDRSHEREQEVELILPEGSAAKIRQALRDAVVSSPWVYPGAEPIVLRDPEDPRRWRVRGRLLEAHFGARFEGELLERVEEQLERAAHLELQKALDDHDDAPQHDEP